MSKRRFLISVFIIILFSSLLYANTLKNGFVFDDREVILENEFIRGFGNVSFLFNRDYFENFREASYRPVVTFTYFLDYAFWKLKPAGYHFTNLILHVLCCVLVFQVLKILTGRLDTSLAAGLIFAAHPVLTEAVNGISFREDLLALFFCLVSLSAYLKNTRGGGSGGKYYLLSAGAFLLAAFSKETAVILPAIILAAEYCFPFKKNKKNRKKIHVQFIGILAAFVFYLIIRFFIFRVTGLLKPVETPFSGRMMMMSKVLIHYLRLMVLPLGLRAEYQFIVPQSFAEPGVLLSFGTLILILAGSIALRRRARTVSFGIWWIFIALIPVMNFIPLQNPAAERYLYFPMVGFSVILAEGVRGILSKRAAGKRALILTIYTALLLFWSVLTVRRNAVWRDDLVFYAKNLKKSPDSPRFRFDLGNAYLRRGKYEEAISEYRVALRLKSDYLEAGLNMGSAYLRMKRYDEAISEFKNVLEKKYEYPEVHYNLGNTYLAKEMYDEALASYKEAVKFKPDLAGAYNNMGYAFLMKEDYRQAIEAYKRAVEIDPDFPDARSNLGGAYLRVGEYERAREEWEQLLSRYPGHPQARKGMLMLKNLSQ